MKLHWSPRSPFVRKVMIVLHEKGLVEKVECVRSVVVLAGPVNPEVLADNPLGKIPVLVPDDGPALFDSRVICEYLDGIAPTPQMIPGDFAGRIECLRWQALGDGLTDVLILWRNEVAGGQYANPVICNSYEAKALAAVAQLEAELPELTARAFGLGHVAAICALGQLELRYGNSGWRAAHPALAAWYDEMQARPSVAATAIQDDGAAVMGQVEMPLRFGSAA